MVTERQAGSAVLQLQGDLPECSTTEHRLGTQCYHSIGTHTTPTR